MTDFPSRTSLEPIDPKTRLFPFKISFSRFRGESRIFDKIPILFADRINSKKIGINYDFFMRRLNFNIF